MRKKNRYIRRRIDQAKGTLTAMEKKKMNSQLGKGSTEDVGNEDAIGQRLEQIRAKKGWSIYYLAKKSGLSRSFISQVEKDLTSPSIASLKKITNALGISINELFNSELLHRGNAFFCSPAQRRIFKNPSSRVIYEFLFPNSRLRVIDAYYFVIEPKGKSDFYQHEGEECGSLLEGTLKLTIGDEEYILNSGDSIYFKSSIPHKWENVGEKEVRGFWVVSPPSF